MSIFFLGTCRVHEPVAVLRARGLHVIATPHRLHSLKQTHQFIRYVTSGEPDFSEKTIGYVSQYSDDLRKSGKSEEVFFDLRERLPNYFRSAKSFAIEISSLREFPMRQADGSTLYLDKLVAPKDVDFVRSTLGDAVATMRDIKKVLQKPIVWIPHITPPPAEGLDVVINVRRHLSDVLRQAAATVGDDFFDPAPVAARLGAGRFFKKNGADTEHLSDDGAAALADHYARFIK